LFARKLRVLLIAAAALLVGVGGAVGYFTFRGVDARAPGSQIEARIQVPGSVFRVATGDGSVWVLTRAPDPAVWRIDPKSNEVVGPPTRLPVDPWDLVVGSGSVWVAPNGADGRITRIDVHSGRITARISARPIYFGSEVVFGGGYLWIGNDDERYKGGSTISKLDPATNRIIDEPLRLGSPQSLAFGGGALWDADHSGWLVKIDPATLEVSARRRLDFGPHGVLVARDAVYVADSHGNRLVKADSETANIRQIAPLPLGPIFPAYGFGALWSGSEAAWQGEPDDRVVRIDPDTLSIVESVHAGGPVVSVAVGFGSVWAALRTGEVVRINPA
jgi:DNA-binding beta-propeller fold protein YncE